MSVNRLYSLIKRYYLDVRHPERYGRVVRRIERGRMTPQQAAKWLKKRILHRDIERQIREGNYLPPAPTPDDLQREQETPMVTIGHYIERPEVELQVPVTQAVPHMLIVGKPDSGKSVTLRMYLKRVHELGLQYPDRKIACVVFDPKKDIPNPRTILGDDVVHLQLQDPSKVRFALNGPPGVFGQVYAASMATILGARLGLIVSRTCLSAVYLWLLGLLNPAPKPGQPLKTPSVRLILDVLLNSPAYCWGEKIDYIKTLVQKLSALLVDAQGLLDADRGFEIVQDIILQGKHCVIDTSKFEPPYLRYLIADIILTQLLLYRLHNHLKTTRTCICLAYDEGDFFLSPDAQAAYVQTLSPASAGARWFREYGVQFIVCASSLQRIDPYLVTGMTCTFAHCTVDADSIRQIQRTMMLNRGTEKLLPALKAGQCIYREAQGPYPYPGLAQIDYIAPDHSPKAGSYDSTPFTEATGLDDLPHIQKALEERIQECSKSRMRRQHASATGDTPNEVERKFLDHMALHEYEPLEIVFSYMGNVTAGTQKRILDKLTGCKLIEVKTVRAGRYWVRFGRITEKGWEHLGKSSSYPSLRGGVVHTNVCYLKRRLDLKNGCEKSFCEHRLEGSSGFHDVVSIKDGKYYITEAVIACDTNLAHHARDCFLNSTTPVATLTIVTLLKSEHKKLREMILSDPELVFCIDRVSFLTVDSILRGLYESR